MILIPSLNAVICKGDFVVALMSENAANPTVCRVNSTVPPDQLIVTWWLTITEISSRGTLQSPPPVPIEDYSNVLKCRLTEVCELCSSLSTISSHAVKDVAFVFHINILENDLTNCAGMSRVFYTRYRYDEANRLTVIDCNLHSCFSNIVVRDSFPSRIWHSIIDVKEKVEKCMNDAKQYQPCRKMVLLKYSLESWDYFYRNMFNSGAVVVYFRRNYTQKNMHCDLTLSSRKVKKMLTLVRVDSSSSMMIARCLFGLTFGIGVRNRAPNKGDPAVSLHHADIINLVDVESNLYDNLAFVAADRQCEFVVAQGVDFLYEQFTRTLKIRLRYAKVDAHQPIVASTLNLIHTENNQYRIANQVAVTNRQWLPHIAPGTFFAKDDDMVEVIRVHGDEVVVVSESSNVEEVININEAAELLSRYIG